MDENIENKTDPKVEASQEEAKPAQVEVVDVQFLPGQNVYFFKPA